MQEVNTFNGTIWRKYIAGKDTLVFKLTEYEQKLISSYAEEIGIHGIRTIVDKDSCDDGEIRKSLPILDYKLEFQFDNGQRRTFEWHNNDCDDPTIELVQVFADSLTKIILKKDELKDIKDFDLIIL